MFDMCPRCWSRDVRHQSCGDILCATCFYSFGLDCSGQTSYTESHGYGTLMPMAKRQQEPRQFTMCHYKRLAHFNTWLNKIRGEEINTIHHETIRVVQEFLLARSMNPSIDNILVALKRTNNQRHYDNVYFLYKHFNNGIPLLIINAEQQQVLLQLFHMIQEPFAKYRHKTNRVNMMHYGYLLSKFFQLLEWDNLCDIIRPIKSKEKLYMLDAAWKLITAELKLPFHRSSM